VNPGNRHQVDAAFVSRHPLTSKLVTDEYFATGFGLKARDSIPMTVVLPRAPNKVDGGRRGLPVTALGGGSGQAGDAVLHRDARDS